MFKIAPPIKGVGMARAADPDAIAYTPREVTPKAALSLARPGWMGSPRGNAPFGTEATDRHQVQWVREPDPTPKPKKQPRLRHRSPLTTISELPLPKLAKLPRKYGWQKG